MRRESLFLRAVTTVLAAVLTVVASCGQKSDVPSESSTGGVAAGGERGRGGGCRPESGGAVFGGGGGSSPVPTGKAGADAGTAATLAEGGESGEGGEGGAVSADYCEPGSVERRVCGACGWQERFCGEDGAYPPYAEACADEIANPQCIPPTQSVVECYRCGKARSWCNATTCTWEQDLCLGVESCQRGVYEWKYARPANPPPSCDVEGSIRVRKCNEECEWGPYTDECYPPPAASALKIGFMSSFGSVMHLFASDPDYAIPIFEVMLSPESLGPTANIHQGRWAPGRASYTREDSGVQVLDLSGDLPVELGSATTAADGTVAEVEWSAKGDRLAVTYDLSRDAVPNALRVAEVAADAVHYDSGNIIPDVHEVSGLVWSPAGNWLAVRVRPAEGEEARLALINTVAAPYSVQYVTDAQSVEVVRWAPNGRKLAFATSAGVVGTVTPGADTTIRAERLPAEIAAVTEIAWLGEEGPDLVLSAANESGSVAPYTLDGHGQCTNLPTVDAVSGVQARGRRVFFWSDSQIWRVDLSRGATNDAEALVDKPPGTIVAEHVWSVTEDATQIVFASDRLRPGHMDVFVLDVGVDGQEPTRVTYLRDNSTVRELRLAGQYVAFLARAAVVTPTRCNGDAATCIDLNAGDVCINGFCARSADAILHTFKLTPDGPTVPAPAHGVREDLVPTEFGLIPQGTPE